MRYRIITIIGVIAFLLSSCYKEQHFDMPGPYGDDVIVPDTMPFPFDTTRQEGMWLIKDGVPDYSKISLKSYVDFRPQHGDSTVWEIKDGGLTSAECYNFFPMLPTDHFGGDANSFQYNSLSAKPMVKFAPGSKWYFYARMSIPAFYGTAPYFLYASNGGWGNRSTSAFDGNDGAGNPTFYAQVKGALLDNSTWPLMTEVFQPGEAFDFELVCVDYFVYLKINGQLIWLYNLPAEEFNFPIIYTPWRGSVTFYDMYMDGDIEEVFDYVTHEEESGYKTIQAPALTKTSNGDVLMFAEGRVRNYELTTNADYAARRSNATDIVMKRSSDGGKTWSELTTIEGDKTEVNIAPTVTTDVDDKHFLLYTKDNSGYLDATTFEIYKITSNDGNTWSAPELLDFSAESDGYALKTISGHGLVKKNASNVGRFVNVVQCEKEGETKTLAAIYSDDEGATWSMGATISDDIDLTGGNIVELSDGRLMLLLSHSSTTTKLKVAYSDNGGETWGATEYSTLGTGERGYRYSGSTVVAQDGEIVHFTPQKERTGSDYVNGMTTGQPPYGEGIGVTTSIDQGNAWTAYESVFTKQTYDSFYFLCKNMDAVALNDGSVLCVTEGGLKGPKDGLVKFSYKK